MIRFMYDDGSSLKKHVGGSMKGCRVKGMRPTSVSWDEVDWDVAEAVRPKMLKNWFYVDLQMTMHPLANRVQPHPKLIELMERPDA